jgi:all-trans-retinol 13,14-reductase
MKVRTGLRYRKKRLQQSISQQPIDHIVIGSGIGGLTTAALLSRLGRKVIVLEQHYTAGGFTHSFEQDGFEWDVGVHYIGQVGNKFSTVGMLFNLISEGRLKWDSMGEFYDEFIVNGVSYKPPVGARAYKRYLKEQFPYEGKAIDQYCAYMQRVELWLPFVFSNRVSNKSWFQKATSVLNKLLPDVYLKTTSQVLDGLTDNATLKAVITGQWGDCGLPAGQSAFLIHCLIAHHYIDGAWYPRGGSAEIARTIIPTIQKSGGEVFTYADVQEILLDEDEKGHSCAVGVRLADGESIYCNSVISACGYAVTKQLLPAENSPAIYQQAKDQNVDASACHLALYVGMEGSPQELQLPVHNLWLQQTTNATASLAEFEENPDKPFPFVYLSCASARDSSWSERFPGKSTLELVAVVPKSVFEPWQGTPWGKRGDEYLALKQKWTDRLLDILYKELPQLKGKVKVAELSTPLSTEYFMRYNDGEIYGLSHTPERFKQDWLRPESDIKGLYMSGQDVLTAGVAGAAMSGVLTSALVVGKSVYDFKKLGKHWLQQDQNGTYKFPILK